MAARSMAAWLGDYPDRSSSWIRQATAPGRQGVQLPHNRPYNQ